MTPVTPADIVAEALADDGTSRPPVIYVHAAHRGPGMYGAMATYFHTEAAQFAGPDGVTEYVRHDAFDRLAAGVVAERERAERAEAECWRLAVLVMAGRLAAEADSYRIDAWALLEESKDNWSAVATLRQAAAAKRREADGLFGYASRAEASP